MIYQASVCDPKYRCEDFDSMASAKAAVETAGSGSVVTFRRDRNLPNLLPAYVDRSCAMDTYENGAWRSVNIF